MYCSFICFEKPFQNKQRHICIWIYCFVIFIICRHTWLWFILFFVLVDMQFSDGYLDLIIIRDCPKLPLLALMSELNKGNHIKSPYVMYFKVSSFYHLLPHLVFLMFSFPVPPYKLTKSTSSHNLLGYKTPWRTDISLFSLDWEKGKGKRRIPYSPYSVSATSILHLSLNSIHFTLSLWQIQVKAFVLEPGPRTEDPTKGGIIDSDGEVLARGNGTYKCDQKALMAYDNLQIAVDQGLATVFSPI